MLRRRVSFHTLGCKLNFSESSTLARQFAEGGFERVAPTAEADICVINSCAVTEPRRQEMPQPDPQAASAQSRSDHCRDGLLRPAQTAGDRGDRRGGHRVEQQRQGGFISTGGRTGCQGAADRHHLHDR